MFAKDFAANLKCAREHAGLTQGQLAVKIGVIPGCISSYECGRTMPNLMRLAYLASALKVTASDLVPVAAYAAEARIDENQTTIFDQIGE